MKQKMTLQERIESYIKITKFPRSIFLGEDNRIVGTWIMGNNYRVKNKYYGGYPAGYQRRIKALFPDKTKPLHLCSGKVDLSIFGGDTVDINPKLKPTYVDNAETLTTVPLKKYDVVLVDVPYSEEDAVHYGTVMLSRNKVLKTLGAGLSVGTHVVWLDQVLPMYRKSEFRIVAVIGIVKSTNHRFRVITIFEKI